MIPPKKLPKIRLIVGRSVLMWPIRSNTCLIVCSMKSRVAVHGPDGTAAAVAIAPRASRSAARCGKCKATSEEKSINTALGSTICS